MNQALFTFHAELNDFLPPARRGAAVPYAFQGRVSVKDAIESLGVPHTEVEAIVVGATPADFAYIVRELRPRLLERLPLRAHAPVHRAGARA